MAFKSFLQLPARLTLDGTDMGWLRLVGSLKLQVSFAEYRLFYRALLQKRPVILRSLLIEATPYVRHDPFTYECRDGENAG